MSDKAIRAVEKGGGDPLRFEVSVRENGGQTRHEVTLARADLARLGGGDGAALVEAAFAFLTDREPKEAILTRFDVSVIARYFPDFAQELPRYLKARR